MEAGQQPPTGGQPAGWYPNPSGAGQRYWDGTQWTENYADAQGSPVGGAATAGSTSMSFGDAIRSGFDHYVKFDGRASVSAFWWWALFAFIVGLVANILDAAAGTGYGYYGVFSGLVGLALLLPGLSVGIRRLHDTGRSGWWILIELIPIIGLIILIVFWVQRSDPGPNQYGPVPVGGVSDGAVAS